MPKRIKIMHTQDNAVLLEDKMPLTNANVNKIKNKQNRDRVNSFLKDMHVQHRVENGYSIMSIIKEVMDEEDIHTLQVKHANFLEFVEEHLPEIEVEDNELFQSVSGNPQNKTVNQDDIKFLKEILKDFDDEDFVVMGAEIIQHHKKLPLARSASMSPGTLKEIIEFYVKEHEC